MMTEAEWYKQREALKSLLVLKETELAQVQRDIEEISFTIESYGSKVGNYIPPPPEAEPMKT